MSEWKEYRLGEIADVRDGTHDSPKQKTIGKPLVTSKHIKGGKIDLTSTYLISEEDFQHINKRSKVDKWDVLFSMIGTIGEMVVVDEEVDFAIKNVGLFKTNDEYTSRWIYYYFKSPEAQNEVSYRLKGSTQQYISLTDLRNFPIKIPPRELGKEIVEILSSLDDKIELNNKINQELEALAQTLFKQWFIDFEFPNENGEPYKSSGGEMIDSELGEIPEGWEVQPITNYIEVKDGTHDSPKQCEEGSYLITSKHLKNSFIDFDSAYKISKEDFFNVNKRSKVDKNDILITMIGTVGNIYFVGEEPDFAIKNIGLFKSSTKPSFSIYLYEYLKSSFILEYYSARLAGSTQQYLTLKVLRDTPIIYSENVVGKFVEVIKGLRTSIINNSNETKALTNLRNSLLPKLISGELEINEISN